MWVAVALAICFVLVVFLVCGYVYRRRKLKEKLLARKQQSFDRAEPQAKDGAAVPAYMRGILSAKSGKDIRPSGTCAAPRTSELSGGKSAPPAKPTLVKVDSAVSPPPAAKEARPTLHTGESGDALPKAAALAAAAPPPPKAVTEEEQRQREAAASATGAVKTSEVKSKLKYEVQGGNYLGFGQGGKLNVGWGRKGATWTAPKEQQDVVTMAVDEGAVGAGAPTKKVVKRGQSLKLNADTTAKI